jgi:hypothetical protein
MRRPLCHRLGEQDRIRDSRLPPAKGNPGLPVLVADDKKWRQ